MTSGQRGSMEAAAPERKRVAAPIERDQPGGNGVASWAALRPAGIQFSPSASLAWIVGILAAAACIAPRFQRGWFAFATFAAIVLLLTILDAVELWSTREEYSPALLPDKKGLRGREGQTIHVPLALTASKNDGRRREIRIAVMPATKASETAFQVSKEPQWLTLEEAKSEEQPAAVKGREVRMWPWTPEMLLLQRGVWPGPRVGTERPSSFHLWRLRRWFDIAESLRIEADMRAGRREILRSPIYRALVASQQTPWTGHGRDFERVREYQPGDNYSEIAWKSTARRGSPVTRLFQWEQKQEVYFVIDQSRASALAIEPKASAESDDRKPKVTRRFLDLAVETALVGATVALELGDEFGLVTYAEEPKSWLRAGSGQFHFHQFRQRLMSIESLPTTADYEALFAAIRVGLRRRAYLVFLADLVERSGADSFSRGVGMVRSSHAVLVTSLLPAHAQPAFSPGEELHTDRDVYAALAGEKENQRLGALVRQMRQLDVHLRYVPADKFLRTVVEGYLESKREQRL